MSERKMVKWSHYFSIYERHLTHFSNNGLLIEIGVGEGGSLRFWRRLTGMRVVGIDNRPECKDYEETNISVRIGDQADYAFLQSIIDEFGAPDIIIDDGSHLMKETNASFDYLYPRLKPNGVYLIEDVHTSYMQGYDGGYLQRGTVIEMAKHRIDEMNAGHTGNALHPTEFTKTIDSMHFYDSVIVFEKGTSKKEAEERML